MVGTHLSQQVYSLINYIQVYMYVHVASSPGPSLLRRGPRGVGPGYEANANSEYQVPLLRGVGPGDKAKYRLIKNIQLWVT